MAFSLQTNKISWILTFKMKIMVVLSRFKWFKIDLKNHSLNKKLKGCNVVDDNLLWHKQNQILTIDFINTELKLLPSIFLFFCFFTYIQSLTLDLLDTWTCNRVCLVIILIVWHLSDCTDQCLDTTHVFCPIMGDITSSRYNTWSSLYQRLMGGWMEKCCTETW